MLRTAIWISHYSYVVVHAFNVEPIADFFDIVSLGESEEWGDEFIDLYKAEKAKGFPGGKEAFLRKAAQIPGTYCPAFYMMWNIQSKAILNL